MSGGRYKKAGSNRGKNSPLRGLGSVRGEVQELRLDGGAAELELGGLTLPVPHGHVLHVEGDGAGLEPLIVQDLLQGLLDLVGCDVEGDV